MIPWPTIILAAVALAVAYIAWTTLAAAIHRGTRPRRPRR